MASQGRGAVFQALLGNGFLTIIKTVAFIVSGSGAMLSEAIHSFADTSNQTLLYIGVKRSQRPADDEFQYGYGADRYVFALLSAMGVFVLGCGVTVYHGVSSLLNPHIPTYSWITFAVLGISLVVDGVVFLAAVRETNVKRGSTGLLEFIKSSTDPTLLAVLFEDFVATIGVLVAAAGIGLTYLTQNPMFDALSSIIIGLLLGVLAIWLGWRNRMLILGPAVSIKKSAEIRAFLETQPSVLSVRTLRTRVLAASSYGLAAEVDYDGKALGRRHWQWAKENAPSNADAGPEQNGPTDAEWEKFAEEFGEQILDALGREVDRIESVLVKEFPRVRHVDIEAD